MQIDNFQREMGSIEDGSMESSTMKLFLAAPGCGDHLEALKIPHR